MKKKFFTFALLGILACTLILTGCSRKMSIAEFRQSLNSALKNTYNLVLTDKDDLSTQGDFTIVQHSIMNSYNETTKTWETTESTTTLKRTGRGGQTILEKTEVNKNKTTESTSKTIYTSITSGNTTSYYVLYEEKEGTAETEKSIMTTYSNEEAFIKAVYSQSKDIFKSLNDSFNVDGELYIYSLMTDSEIKGDAKNCHAKISLTDLSYTNSEGKMESTTTNYYLEIKDLKCDNLAIEYKDENSEVKQTLKVTYSAEITRLDNVDAYL